MSAQRVISWWVRSLEYIITELLGRLEKDRIVMTHWIKVEVPRECCALKTISDTPKRRVFDRKTPGSKRYTRGFANFQKRLEAFLNGRNLSNSFSVHEATSFFKVWRFAQLFLVGLFCISTWIKRTFNFLALRSVIFPSENGRQIQLCEFYPMRLFSDRRRIDGIRWHGLGLLKTFLRESKIFS